MKTPIATKVRLKAYKGPEWGSQPPGESEDLANTEVERLLFELEVLTHSYRLACKQNRAHEISASEFWECRRQWWVGWHRVEQYFRTH